MISHPTILKLQSPPPSAAPLWSLQRLSGNLTELSGADDSANLSLMAALVVDCQNSQQPVAWVTLPDSSFYPPDFADAGVDLSALTVIRVGARHAAFIAAEHLLRSAAFGLVVIDRGTDSVIPIAFQRRLHILARHHDIAVVCLTDKAADTPSAGAMINLHGTSKRTICDDGQAVCEIVFTKVKGGRPGVKSRLVIHPASASQRECGAHPESVNSHATRPTSNAQGS